MSTAAPQKFEFQAEIKQLLDIVIHSLYTEKEIFVRELVSNASDALEKLRHLQLTEKDIHDDQLPLEIAFTTDETAKTITIQDHGLGMTRDELIENPRVKGVSFTTFTADDVVRHPLVARIVTAYDKARS